MAEEYKYCPNCGTNRGNKEEHRIPVRECKDCGKHHCKECSKHLESYQCIHCKSSRISPVGFIANIIFNT